MAEDSIRVTRSVVLPLTEVELLSVIHKQGLDDIADVEKCVLEPNGTFYVEARKPSTEQAEIAGLQSAIEALTREVQSMRTELASRLASD